MPQDVTPTLLSAEAAWYYAVRLVCRAVWYAAIRRGEIPSVRLGRRILVPRQPLDQLLAGEVPGQGGRPDVR
jgi:excisionase family DNA binding protein